MLTAPLSSINLCPINFIEFEKINRITNNLEATLLFSKLKFHQTNSKIRKSGIIWIARSREQIASWFGFGKKKTDHLLSSLEELGLIKKKVGLWYGKKRLFINTTPNINEIPVNLKILSILNEVVGSIRAALVFSKIAFAFANSKIENENKKWCCLKKQELALWSGLSIRTIDSILEILIKKGLILKKKFVWNEKLQTHFHIPDFATVILNERFNKLENQIKQKHSKIKEKTNTQNCRQQPAEKSVSIRIRKNLKKTNNITIEKKLSTSLTENKSNIIFNLIGNSLSNRQLKYLEGAFKNTVERNKIKISNPNELLEQLKFSILNSHQRQGVKTFPHAVSRCMKILSDGNWCTPIGFNNHSVYGRKTKEYRKQQFEEWQKQKELECYKSKKIYKGIQERKNGNISHESLNQTFLTGKAIKIAEHLISLSNSFDPANEKFARILADDLESLVRRGANREQILNCLRNQSLQKL